MQFNTVEFFAFFALVFGLYTALPRKGQNALLLVASYVFYGWWDWRFLSLLAFSTLAGYVLSKQIFVASSAAGKKRWLLASLIVHLGLLGFFKYFNFFLESLVSAGRAAGFELDPRMLAIVLPVGISFYTFHALSYTIDLYRGDLDATPDLATYALYICYFPLLVAGPIARAAHLVPKLQQDRRITATGIEQGLTLVLIGLLRKVVVADFVAPVVSRAFSNPASVDSFALAEAVFLFGVQIYGDFAGYTDIARGVSQMMGIDLMENFRRPYFASNITEFWRRWHISLSTWLRDYLYVPLGGNRHGTLNTYRNLILTMLLGGLWHGAAGTFIVWGALHGCALALHKLWTGWTRREQGTGWGAAEVFRRAVSWAATMIFVWITWVFFRADSVGNALEILSRIVALDGELTIRSVARITAVTAAVLAIDIPQEITSDQLAVLRWPPAVRGAVWGCGILLLLTFWSGDATPFIYFQF